MIHLASQSPRRRVLLEQIGVEYVLVDASVDETRRTGERPQRYVERMASEKALAGIAALGATRAAPVLAADTAVVLDGQVLGKPRDEAHAMEMLEALSGRMHQVFSAVAIAGVSGRDSVPGGAADHRREVTAGTITRDAPRVATSISRVWFRDIAREERRAYCAGGEPLDKAGAYAIQGRAAIFVQRLDGSFSGVMGLPLFETESLLREAGIRV